MQSLGWRGSDIALAILTIKFKHTHTTKFSFSDIHKGGWNSVLISFSYELLEAFRYVREIKQNKPILALSTWNTVFRKRFNFPKHPQCNFFIKLTWLVFPYLSMSGIKFPKTNILHASYTQANSRQGSQRPHIGDGFPAGYMCLGLVLFLSFFFFKNVWDLEKECWKGIFPPNSLRF